MKSLSLAIVALGLAGTEVALADDLPLSLIHI